jgi:hypothetical protein
MKLARVVLPAGLLLGLTAGCASDVVTQVTGDARARERVMAAFASDGALAEQMTQRLLATDSLRVRVLETMLRDSPSAQYVLARIGRNPDAMDYALQAAWSDSISRAHLVARMESIRKAVAAQ